MNNTQTQTEWVITPDMTDEQASDLITESRINQFNEDCYSVVATLDGKEDYPKEASIFNYYKKGWTITIEENRIDSYDLKQIKSVTFANDERAVINFKSGHSFFTPYTVDEVFEQLNEMNENGVEYKYCFFSIDEDKYSNKEKDTYSPAIKFN